MIGGHFTIIAALIILVDKSKEVGLQQSLLLRSFFLHTHIGSKEIYTKNDPFWCYFVRTKPSVMDNDKLNLIGTF